MKFKKHFNDLKTSDRRIKIIFFKKTIERWRKSNFRDFPWRSKKRKLYEIIISEVLLQRTKAETVAKIYCNFLKDFPTWLKLSRANEKILRNTLKPLGLSHQRVKTLISLARILRDQTRLPGDRIKLESYPGIGQYIASAILMICFNKREPLLDVNMARVLERFFGFRRSSDIRFDPYLQDLSRKVLPRVHFKKFNWAILDFAALVCTARNPICGKCLLKKLCYRYNL